MLSGDVEELSGAFQLEHHLPGGPPEPSQALRKARSTEPASPTHFHPSLENPGTAGRLALSPWGLSVVLNSGPSLGKPAHLGAAAPSQPRVLAQMPF